MNISFDDKCSDRKVCMQAYDELCGLFPQRSFNLILVNKALAQVEALEREFFRRIYPQTTHLDFNIGAVLGFASRAEGILHPSKSKVRTGSRIVLDGLGADEIFGGYRRYRTAFLRGGYPELREEMAFGSLYLSRSQ